MVNHAIEEESLDEWIHDKIQSAVNPFTVACHEWVSRRGTRRVTGWANEPPRGCNNELRRRTQIGEGDWTRHMATNNNAVRNAAQC